MSRHQSIPIPVEYDIVVKAPDGALIAVVECKRLKLTTSAEAAHLRRSFHAYASDLSADYFMLALPASLFRLRPIRYERN